MGYSALQNSPITVNLLTAANDTGWTVDGQIATHQSCNSGYITLTGYSLVVGKTYQVSWSILSISSGYVQLFAGSTGGVQRTAPNLFVETIIASGTNPLIKFFSNGNCQIQQFNIRDVSPSAITGTTIVYAALNKKWSDFRNYYPDYGFSLYTNTITFYNGDLYTHQNGSGNTNNFYGTPFQSKLKFVDAKDAPDIKIFEALSYQANQLMITTNGGIQTSLGQLSTLIDSDFLKEALTDGVNQVNIYQNANVYSASFLQDENDDVISGHSLKGNYVIVELVTVDASKSLTLFTVSTKSAKIHIGNR